MTPGGMARLVAADLRRHWRHFAMAAVGIVLGVAALAFFLALGLQVRRVLLEQVFPADRLEVAPRSADLDLLAIRLPLGRDALEADDLGRLAEIEGVLAVRPRMRLTVPALAVGGAAVFGAGLQSEVVADGIDPELLSGELGGAFREVSESFVERPCSRDGECGPDAYCAVSAGICRPYLPAVVSPQVVELYNGALRRAYRLPKLNPDAIAGLSFELIIGASSFAPSSTDPLRERVRLVGVSEWAIPLGLSLPLGEVRRANRRLDSPAAGERFHSAILEIASKDALPGVVAAVEASGLEVSDRGAGRAALLTAVITAALALVGVVLVAVSSAHIMHVLWLVVLVRRRELGVLRAVGARRRDIRALLVLEAAVVGAVAGLLGVVAALAAGAAADAFAGARFPDLPFKPDSFFAFEPALLAAVVALAVGACALGALAPARRAAAGDPADALAGR
ncbi:MAG: FtsX-like permease family protein [Thermoanaerobaculales bacterium]|nr:FtsX-like permease family protein [Thermoanaerobaculales bacterium]